MLQREPIQPTPPPPWPPDAGSGAPGPQPERTELAPVLELLARARRRQRRIALGTAALLALGALALALPLLLALASVQAPVARVLVAVTLTGAAAGFLVFGVWRAHRQAGDLAATARLLSGRIASPVLRRGLLPAFELGKELDSGRELDFSRALARAHIESIGEAARTADLEAALPARPLRLATRAAAAAGLAALILLLVLGGSVSRGARALVASAGPGAKADVSAEPVTAEISLTFRYPAYTRLPDKTVVNTNGEIAAPKGTEVTIKTRADREVGKAFAVVGDAALPLTVQGGRDLSGTILVDKPGSYRFRLQSERGRTLAEGPPIPIAVEPDAAPKVDVLSAKVDGAAKRDGGSYDTLEVDPKSRVIVGFEALDDYGLSEVALLFKLPGATKPQRVILQRAGDAQKRARGEYRWDLVSLGLLAGDKVAYYLEAVDNDAVNGKKAGVSKTYYLKLYSEAEHHREIVQKIEQSWEKLVTLLADRLEGPERKDGKTLEGLLTQSAVDGRALQLGGELQELARALRKEQSPDQLWRALANVGQGLTRKASATADARGTLTALRSRNLPMDSDPIRRLLAAVAAEIAEEEKGVLYLEALVDQQRIEDLVALSRELASKRRELGSLLEKYRTAPNEETRDRLLNEIARLKERMGELMQRMAELSKSINDEHVNVEALQELAKSQQMMSAFDKLQDLLHQGKVEEAMKEMEKLGQMLDQMEQNLQKAAQQFQGGEFAELGKQLKDFSNKLEDLQAGQERLLEQTQKIREAYKQGIQERLAKKGEQFVERLRAKVKDSRERLEQITDESNFFRENEQRSALEELDDLDKALAVKDFDQAAQSAAKALSHEQLLSEDLQRQAEDTHRYPAAWQKQAEEVQKNAQRAKEALPPLQQVQQELSSLFPPPGQSMSEADRQKMKELAGRQSALQQQAGELQSKMDQLNKDAPLFGPQAQEMMRQAGNRMGRAQQQLQGRNPTGATAEERAALDQIGQLKKGLQQQQQQGGASGGAAIPWPWAGAGPRGMDDGSGQLDGSDEEVKIPGADQYQVPEEYRKAILDAMKQAAPEKYKEQVKKYYEEIVK